MYHIDVSYGGFCTIAAVFTNRKSCLPLEAGEGLWKSTSTARPVDISVRFSTLFARVMCTRVLVCLFLLSYGNKYNLIHKFSQMLISSRLEHIKHTHTNANIEFPLPHHASVEKKWKKAANKQTLIRHQAIITAIFIFMCHLYICMSTAIIDCPISMNFIRSSPRNKWMFVARPGCDSIFRHSENCAFPRLRHYSGLCSVVRRHFY